VTAVAGPDGASGTVYTISNAAAGNELATYSRSADGSLTPAGAVSAGGLGTGGGLASQGAVVVTDDGHTVLAVNPGSNSVAAFAVGADGPQLLNTASSGGNRPTSHPPRSVDSRWARTGTPQLPGRRAS
jgi:6-phosphogluconolactonase